MAAASFRVEPERLDAYPSAVDSSIHDDNDDDVCFERGLRLVVSTVTALIVLSLLSAICSIAFTF